MKKIMLLGGSKFLLPIINKAHELGIYVITCDYLPNNYAHKFSDEYVNVSILEKEKVLQVATQLKIDGIMSFACDPGVVTAAYVAEQMGLPTIGPYDSICILQNKGRFRKFLSDNGFNVPVSKAYTDIDVALNDTDIFHWPIIVKPTDSAGSKGVSKVDNPLNLKEAIKKALSYSHCDEFIIEDFLEQKGFSSDCDSFSINGKMVAYGFNSQRFDKRAANPYTPAGYTWPSSISKRNIMHLKNEIQRLITLLKLKTSVFNIEVRECNDGKAYIMELTPRGGGNRLSEMMKIATNVDFIECAIKASLGIPFDLNEIVEKPIHLAEIILHSESSGVFDGLDIDESIKKYVFEVDLWVSNGDIINSFNGANDAIGTIVLIFDSFEQMDNFMNNQDSFIKVRLK